MSELNLNKKIKQVEGESVSINGASTFTGVYQESISAYDPIISLEEPASIELDWDTTRTHITPDIDSIAVQPYECDWSSDDTYLVAAWASSQGMGVYKKTGTTTFSELIPASGGSALSIAWCRFNDTHIALGLTASPFIRLYKRSGDTFSVITGPTTLPTNDATAMAWSPNGDYLAVGNTGTTKLIIYKRSVDTLTAVTAPSVMPTGDPTDITWSGDSTYMVVSHATSPFISIYKRSGDTFTKLANPSTLPASNGKGVDFSSDSTYLVVAHENTPYLKIYKRTDDTFNLLTNPSSLPSANPTGVKWTPNSEYFGVVFNDGNRIALYKRSGDTFTRTTDPGDGPNTPHCISFSGTGKYFAVTSYYAPRIDGWYTTGTDIAAYNKIYSSANDLSDLSDNISNLNAIGYAASSGSLNDNKTDIIAVWKEV